MPHVPPPAPKCSRSTKCRVLAGQGSCGYTLVARLAAPTCSIGVYACRSCCTD